jgi:exopolysaccharide biosynthesis polyprenyl glycosylphosphotransferase
MAITRPKLRAGLAYFLADLLAIAAAYDLTYMLRFCSAWGARAFGAVQGLLDAPRTGIVAAQYVAFYAESGPRIFLILAATLTFLYGFLGLYEGPRFIRRRNTGLALALANAVALGLFYGYFYLTRNQFHPRGVFATLLLLNTMLAMLMRSGAGVLLQATGWDNCPAVLAGSGREADGIARLTAVARRQRVRVVQRVETGPETPVADLLARIEEAVRSSGAALVICAVKRLNVREIMEVLDLTARLGVAAKILSDSMNVLAREARLPVDVVYGMPLAHFDLPRVSGLYPAIKRASSVAVAAAALVLLAPLMGLIALLIRLTSPGPALFVQERMGVNRRPFPMYKFRTMHNRAEELQAAFEEFNEASDALFKIRDDPRVTPVGRLLRRFSLDELPQLLNVVRGEMTLVGPRPLPRRDFESYYEEWHYQRHGGLPGLTGLWQVSGRSDLGFENMCILDVYYLRNAGFMLDLRLLLRTAGVVLFARGAY